jgi:hypothetical protein
VFVPGSRRYADPATYLYTPEQWAPRRTDICKLVGKPADAAEAIEQGKEELHAALAQLDQTLAQALPDDTGAVRLDDDDKLVIPPLSAEDVPGEAKELRAELAGAVRADRLPADRAGRAHALSGLLHPRRRPQAGPLGRSQAQHPQRAHRQRHEPGVVQDERGLRHSV